MDGRPADRRGSGRQRAVLAALAVDVGRPVRAESLVDRVWGDSPPPGFGTTCTSTSLGSAGC
ncbi:hypothetical protein NKG94_13315 [Micromonospora sp. M12]